MFSLTFKKGLTEEQIKQAAEEMVEMFKTIPNVDKLTKSQYGKAFDWEELCKGFESCPLENVSCYEQYCELFRKLLTFIILDWEYFVDLNVSNPETEVFVDYHGFYSHNTVFRSMFDNLAPQHKYCLVCNLLSNFITRKKISVQFYEIDGSIVEGTEMTKTQDKMCCVFTLIYLKKIIIYLVDQEINANGSFELRKRLDSSFDKRKAVYSEKDLNTSIKNSIDSMANKKISQKKVEKTQQSISEEATEAPSYREAAFDIIGNDCRASLSFFKMMQAHYEDIPEEYEKMMKDTLPKRYVWRKQIVKLFKASFSRMQRLEFRFEYAQTLHKNENIQEWFNMVQLILVNSLFENIPFLFIEMSADIVLDPTFPAFPAQAQWIKQEQAYFEKIFHVREKEMRVGENEDMEFKGNIKKFCKGRGLVDIATLHLFHVQIVAFGENGYMFKKHYPTLSHPAKFRMKFQFKCANCGKDARKICSSCKVERYCSVDCLKSHWKHHKAVCQSIRTIQEKKIENSKKYKNQMKDYNIYL